MKPIAVFYHCILHSRERNIPEDYAINLITDQMSALKDSGLAEAASAIYIGVNGDAADGLAVACLIPEKAVVITHGKDATTEIHTMNLIRDWIGQHRDWNVLYHHTKGVSTPNQADNWRRRMEKYCVWGWRKCVEDLSHVDCCGCHWLTPERNGNVIKSPFFGGTFWWSRASYLQTLPPLPPPTWQNRYEAETWIGKGPKRPRVVDYCPGWPTP